MRRTLSQKIWQGGRGAFAPGRRGDPSCRHAPSFHDCHIASATAATVHPAVQATASASQIAGELSRGRCGSGGSSSAGVGSSGRNSPSIGSCTCFISRSPRVGNTRRRRFTRNHADLSRAGLQLKLSRRSAIEHILRRHRLIAHRTAQGPDVRAPGLLFGRRGQRSAATSSASRRIASLKLSPGPRRWRSFATAAWSSHIPTEPSVVSSCGRRLARTFAPRLAMRLGRARRRPICPLPGS
jgi:hypothetical protein